MLVVQRGIKPKSDKKVLRIVSQFQFREYDLPNIEELNLEFKKKYKRGFKSINIQKVDFKNVVSDEITCSEGNFINCDINNLIMKLGTTVESNITNANILENATCTAKNISLGENVIGGSYDSKNIKLSRNIQKLERKGNWVYFDDCRFKYYPDVKFECPNVKLSRDYSEIKNVKCIELIFDQLVADDCELECCEWNSLQGNNNKIIDLTTLMEDIDLDEYPETYVNDKIWKKNNISDISGIQSGDVIKSNEPMLSIGYVNLEELTIESEICEIYNSEIQSLNGKTKKILLCDSTVKLGNVIYEELHLTNSTLFNPDNKIKSYRSYKF